MTPFADRVDALAVTVNGAMREVLDRAMRRAPAREDPMVERVYRSMYDYLANGGKRMHGLVVTLCYEVAGGTDEEGILPVAAGFQLYHQHSLVHDDIYDEDDRRRGSPTIHRAFADHVASQPGPAIAGRAQRIGAIAAFAQGKIIHALAFEAILSAPFPVGASLAALRELNWHGLHDNAGQLLDVFHEAAPVLDPAECMAIARIKTGRLFTVAAGAGARFGGADAERIEGLQRWIEDVATAYQLQDDLEDLEAESEKGAGRGVGTDLRTAKPTYLFALALQQATPQQAEVLRSCHGPHRAETDELVGTIRATGAPELCRRQAQRLVDESPRYLEGLLPAASIQRLAEFGAYYVSKSYWRRPLPPARDPLEAR